MAAPDSPKDPPTSRQPRWPWACLVMALLWVALAAAVTVRTARRGLPFALTWWSFVFPLGTLVTGTSALAVRVPSAMFSGVAVVLYGALVLAWATVAVRTVFQR